MSKFDKTIQMIKDYENKPFDYDGSIYGQVDVINQFINDAGNSGFSASCVASRVMKKVYGFKNGYTIVDLNEFLFPQYEPIENVLKFVKEQKEMFLNEATKSIKENPEAHPNVMRRWELIVKHKGDVLKAIEEHKKIGPADETEYIRKILGKK